MSDEEKSIPKDWADQVEKESKESQRSRRKESDIEEEVVRSDVDEALVCSAAEVATPPPARFYRRCGLATRNHPGRCGVQHCTVPLPGGLRDTFSHENSLALSSPARKDRKEEDSDVMDTSIVCVHSHRKDDLCGFPCTGCKGYLYHWCTHCKVSRGYVTE